MVRIEQRGREPIATHQHQPGGKGVGRPVADPGNDQEVRANAAGKAVAAWDVAANDVPGHLAHADLVATVADADCRQARGILEEKVGRGRHGSDVVSAHVVTAVVTGRRHFAPEVGQVIVRGPWLAPDRLRGMRGTDALQGDQVRQPSTHSGPFVAEEGVPGFVRPREEDYGHLIAQTARRQTRFQGSGQVGLREKSHGHPQRDQSPSQEQGSQRAVGLGTGRIGTRDEEAGDDAQRGPGRPGQAVASLAKVGAADRKQVRGGVAGQATASGVLLDDVAQGVEALVSGHRGNSRGRRCANRPRQARGNSAVNVTGS